MGARPTPRPEMKKTDNHNLHAKLELRRLMLRGVGPLNVLDAFSGKDEAIWTVLRKELPVGHYLALDIKRKNRRVKMDSLRYLQAQKWDHNVIDLDAYGSPWSHWVEVLKKGRACTVFLTIGTSGMGKQSTDALRAVGIPENTPTGIHRQISEIIVDYCLALCEKHGMVITSLMEALNPGGNARYIAVRIENTHNGNEPTHNDERQAGLRNTGKDGP